MSASSWLKPYKFPIRIYIGDDGTEGVMDFHVLLPHEYFAETWNKSTALFAKVMLGKKGHDGIRSFWRTVSNSSWMQSELRDTECCIPFSSYGDEASVGGTYNWIKFLVITCSSLLPQMHGIDRHGLYCVLPCDWIIPHKTLFDV